MEKHLLNLGDSVDHLITTDMKWPGGQRGLVETIFRACREVVGGPVCLHAADSLRERVTKDSTVIISTGFLLPPFFPLGETDGPPGAVAIAHALHHGIGARILFLTERELIGILQATCAAAGLAVYSAEEFKDIPGAITISDFTYEADQATLEGRRILDEVNPSAVITVEKIGRNDKDVYHSARGSDMSRYVAKVDYLVEEAQNRGILTIGIGDLGNEIGLGAVADVAKKTIGELGEQCKCGCGGGIVTKVGAEIPIMTTISNWGAYGVAACLAALLGRADIFHSADVERRMLEECSRAGAKDGTRVSPTPSSDGVSLDGNRGFIHLLHELVRIKTTTSRAHRI